MRSWGGFSNLYYMCFQNFDYLGNLHYKQSLLIQISCTNICWMITISTYFTPSLSLLHNINKNYWCPKFNLLNWVFSWFHSEEICATMAINWSTSSNPATFFIALFKITALYSGFPYEIWFKGVYNSLYVFFIACPPATESKRIFVLGSSPSTKACPKTSLVWWWCGQSQSMELNLS